MKHLLTCVFVLVLLLQVQACDQRSQEQAPEIESPKEEPSTLTPDIKESDEKTAVLEPKVLDQNQEFDEFKEAFLERFWELNPSFGVYVGYYKHDDQLLVPNGVLRASKRSFYVTEFNLGLLKFLNNS